jgi:hypothetical protein
MTRSKFSTKVVLLATAIGLSTAAFAGSQPAAAQSYTCPDGLASDPIDGCTLGGDDYGYWGGGYYGYPYGLYYGRQFDHRGDHGFGHGMGGMSPGVGVAHFGGDGFAHGMGGGFHGGGGFGGGGHR